MSELKLSLWIFVLWLVCLSAICVLSFSGCGMEEKGKADPTPAPTPEVVVGPSGKDGSDGAKGKDGTSCSVSKVEAGAIVTCGDTQQIIWDGKNGKDAVQTVVSTVQFCKGVNPADWPEVALKLEDGTLVALFTDGSSLMNTRLVILQPGWYESTGPTHCLFRVDSENQITYD
jgi:hypothetical protein